MAEPRQLGRYTLYAEIASGGMATVHLGRMAGAKGFSRVVAIKRMLPQFARDADFVSMFIDEGRLASRISHPNVVTTFDVVRADGELFIVMEYVPGETLERLLRACRKHGKRVPAGIAAAIAHGVLAGLHAAHDATSEDGKPLEIVHRDVSPQNVLVGADGVPRLLDFGIATAKERLHVTREGKLKGKLRYLPPEAFGGEPLTRTADVYATAVVLWETLTGRPLFSGDNEAQTLGRILEGRVRPPSELVPGVSPELDAVVMRGLARDPGARYPDARQMARELREAAPLAYADEIAEWISEVAPEALEKHKTVVRELESGSAPRLLELRPLDEPAPNETRGITHSVLAEWQPPEPPPNPRRWVVTGAVLFGVTTVGIAIAASLGGSARVDEPLRSAATAIQSVEIAPLVTAPSAATSAAPSASVAPPPARVRTASPKPKPCQTLKYKDENGIWRVKKNCIK